MPNHSETLYPSNVEFVTVFDSAQGLKTKENGVIKSQKELDATFGELAFSFSSKTDFATHEIVFVALGMRPTSGYKVAIKSIVHLSDVGKGYSESTEVSYAESTEGNTHLDVLTFPTHAVAILIQEGNFNFNLNS